jgi:hypothetical protein
MDNQGRNQQFKCEIVDGKLTISIGLDVLAHALQMSPVIHGLHITDMDTFSIDFLRELENEDETGATAIHRALDLAAIDAVENGAEGCELIDEANQ